MNLTLDGYLSGINCELDWHFKFWDNEMSDALCEQLSFADTILLGRKTYLAMHKYWSQKLNNNSLAGNDIAFAMMINQYNKLVVSRSLQQTNWDNTSILRGDFKEKLSALKKENGKNIVLFGSSTLVQQLMGNNLIDEYQLYLHPVYLKNGKLFFRKTNVNIQLELVKEQLLKSGVALLFYRTVA